MGIEETRAVLLLFPAEREVLPDVWPLDVRPKVPRLSASPYRVSRLFAR